MGYGGSPQRREYEDPYLDIEQIMNGYFRQSDLINHINERPSRLNPSENI